MIKPSRSSQRWIQRIRPVRRTNDDDGLFARCEVIHTCQELSDNTAFHFPLGIFTFGGDGIDFVQEEDTRCDFLRAALAGGPDCDRDEAIFYLGFIECISQRLFRLARHAGYYGRCGYRDKRQFHLLHSSSVFFLFFFTAPPPPKHQTHTCQALDQLCLTTTGHTMQQHTLWPGDTRMQVDLRVEKGKSGDFE